VKWNTVVGAEGVRRDGDDREDDVDAAPDELAGEGGRERREDGARESADEGDDGQGADAGGPVPGGDGGERGFVEDRGLGDARQDPGGGEPPQVRSRSDDRRP
jgi:hypothetical protein